MTFDWKKAIVRVLDTSGQIVGTGFLVSRDGLVVTCAHVIENARSGPNDTIRITFTNAGDKLVALVLPEYWYDSDKEDLALLQVQGDLPWQAHPLPLGTSIQSEQHRFQTFGFPEGVQGGVLGHGKISGALEMRGLPALQLSTSNVTTGFSGAPIWDVEDQRVVGMVTGITRPDAYQRLTSIAFALSSDVIVGICPRLVGDPRAFEELKHPIPVHPTAAPVLEKNGTVSLQGKRYLVRELVTRRSFGLMAVQTARASDVALKRDVALRRLENTTDTPEGQVILSNFIRHIGSMSQAAARCEHLPQIYDVVDEKPYSVWGVIEWVQGPTLGKLFPHDGPLPNRSAVNEILGWGADICDALAELMRHRISHGRVHEEVIQMPPGRRGAVLVAPDFVGSLGPIAAASVPFDPMKDMRELAAVMYRILTHKTPTQERASSFNPILPSTLDAVLLDGLQGATKRPWIPIRASPSQRQSYTG